MVNISRLSPSAVGGGEGTSNTTARSTISPRRRGAGRRATTRRDNLELLRSSNQGQSGEGHTNNEQYNSRRKYGTLNFVDAKRLIERRQLQNKKGILSDEDIRVLAKQWQDQRTEGELNQQTVEMELSAMEKTLAQYNVEQLGEMPVVREDGTMRILVCQMGGLASAEVREFKLAATERLIKKYDVNVCVCMELNFNWAKVNSSANLASWFNNEREVRSVTAHNTTETSQHFSKHQPGGTGIVCMHEFLQYARRPSIDERGLGRWCSWPFFSNPSHTTRIVVAYRPCATKTKGLKTIYQQHIRFMQKEGIPGTPIQMFDNDLTNQIKIWRTAGERIILLMDVNGHPLHNNLYKQLMEGTEPLEEFTHKCWGAVPPHTYARGSSPIDGGYKSPEIEIINLSMLTFAESPGDHRSLILDVSTRSLLGEYHNKICRPVSRRLVMSQKSSVENYNRIVQEQCDIHRIQIRLDAIDKMTKYCGYPVPTWLKTMMLKVYAQLTEIRRYAEKKCRKILTPHSEFGPTVKTWYDRIHAYRQLIRLRSGKAANDGNIYRFARRNNIQNPELLTTEEMQDGLQLARLRKADLRKTANGLRRAHMQDSLLDAQAKNQQRRARAIKERMQREGTKKMWYLIKRTTKDPFSPSVRKVQRIIEGEVVEFTEQEDIEQAIQYECGERFTLAHSAPIMSILLGHQLRYLSDEKIAREIITGTYKIPEELDPATKMILEEIGKMGVKILNGEDNEIIITPADFKLFWKRVNEFTSSSMSGIHNGHYKAAAQDEFSTNLLSQQLTIIARTGVPPETWGVGLQVMLEKIAGVCLVDKLRSIQLYEADFNFYNQFVFGRRAMDAISGQGLIPEELFSQKGSTAEDAKFDRTLTTDLSRQARQPMTIVSADAAYCYDRVNHVIMSLIWLTLLNGNIPPIAAALVCLQTMKFFQRTGFGDSKTFFGGPNIIKYIMGLGQGSRAAPPSWIQVSSVIVNVYKQLGLGGFFIDPMTEEQIHSMGALYVDDADLYTLKDDMTDHRTLCSQTQLGLDTWSNLLQATGGALKPEKCFWYLLEYSCKEGEWSYQHDCEGEMTITNQDGTTSVIQQKSAEESMKTLGVHDSPAGGNKEHLDYIRTKMAKWINRMKNGHLPSHIAWVAYRQQLWPGLRYGIGTMTNDIEEAEELTQKEDWAMLNILGIARTVTKGLRRLQPTFGGFGLVSLATEQLISRVNLLMQHYHTPSNISKKLDASMRYLQLQLGTAQNPFDLDYNEWSHLAPLSWTKMIWRSLDYYNIKLQMKYDKIPIPREHDQIIMQIIHATGMSKAAERSMNRCRVHLGAIFLSDITTADGRYLEQSTFNIKQNGVNSKFKFPKENPSHSDKNRWTDFWNRFTSTGKKLPRGLGKWMHQTHRQWRWYYNKEVGMLYQVNNTIVQSYRKSQTYRTRGSATYERQQIHAQDEVELGYPSSVTATFEEAAVTKQEEGPRLATEPADPADFWEFLYAWGGKWMWEGIDANQETRNNLTWLVAGMKINSLIWITDGSYDRNRAKDLSGVGWIIFCTATAKRLSGSFWEKSSSASSYRAEMLGLCALHLLARALSEFYKIEKWKATICCDNERALECSTHHQCRIKPSAKCADIRRSFRSTKEAFSGQFKYDHVYGHMDDHLLWHQLSLKQQLNCVCDTLAKRSVTNAILNGYQSTPTQLLPKEDVALIIKGNKITDDIAQPIRFHASKESARKYFITRKKKPWAPACFDAIDWEHLELAQMNKPEMYKIWRAKQSSGFCGTRVQVGRYSGEGNPDESCPNCGQKEDAEHLMRCPNADRTRLLKEQAENLREWMEKDDRTDPELGYWIHKYILLRGSRLWSEMEGMSEPMRDLARSQDTIGWRRFMEGHITTKIYDRQNFHLQISSSRLNATDWTKQFITKLLQITHSQWIYRNISLHDQTNGYLHNKNIKDLSEEIHRLSELEKDEVPKESQFLLEMNLGTLTKQHTETQAYWITAVQAARTATARESALGRRAKRSRKKHLGKISSRVKLGIVEAERQIIRDRIRNQCCGDTTIEFEESDQSVLDKFIVKRPHTSSLTRLMKSNKRLRKPD